MTSCLSALGFRLAESQPHVTHIGQRRHRLLSEVCSHLGPAPPVNSHLGPASTGEGSIVGAWRVWHYILRNSGDGGLGCIHFTSKFASFIKHSRPFTYIRESFLSPAHSF